jgi:UDP-N-acetylglucosamine 1-carboxyvinyltransferase
MDSFIIRGGTRLNGTVEISGSKNSSLPILACCLLASEGTTVLHKVPRLWDVDSMNKLIGELGCHVYRHDPVNHDGIPLGGRLDIEVRDEKISHARYDIVKTMRASICVLGPLLAKRGKCQVALPGGCAIGDRPIDLHIRGLQMLGAEFRTEGGNIVGEVPGGKLKGNTIFLGGAQGPTVLGTINVMAAATLAEGVTEIVGASCEPEVVDCGNFLLGMGAKIYGHGTHTMIIKGVDKLVACEHRVIQDRIEAATFMLAAAITRGEITIKNCNTNQLTAVIDRLLEMGVQISSSEGDWTVRSSGVLRPTELTTQPYPGVPTDCQAQFMAAMCLAAGMSAVTERIFPDRFLHVGELNRMGAKIRKEGPTAIIQGVRELNGANVMASDLRASAALVLAGLAARGETKIDRVYHLDRGYEKLERKLQLLGAKIERVSEK